MKGYEDLVKLLKHMQATGGLETDEKSICEYQDMIGHSTIEQLKELANSEYRESFYRVYGYSYGTVETIRFYCKNSKKIEELYEQIDEAQADAEEAKDALKKEQEKTKNFFELADENRQAWEEETKKNRELQTRIAEQDAEITKLKAKLYDMMTR